MKIYLKGTSELLEDDVLFETKLLINVDMNTCVIESTSDIVRFPSREEFREALVTILQDEYKFEIIAEDDGTSGQLSTRPDSESVYFNTYYDLSDAQSILDNLGVSRIHAPNAGKVHCFIHFRFSGHPLEDIGDVEHNTFLDNNVKKHTKDHPEINYIEREAEVQLPETDLYLHYDTALENIKYELDGHIAGWVRKAYKQHPELF